MIELKPDKKNDNYMKPDLSAKKGRHETIRPPAIDDLRFFVKGSLTLFAKFVQDLDWFLAKVNSRNKT